MEISTFCILSIISLSTNLSNDTSKIPVGNWVTENFEFIKIDTAERSLNLISDKDGSEIYGADVFVLGDTMSFQLTYYELFPQKDTIVHSYDFQILYNKNDSLVLKPISELSTDLMRKDEALVFTRYGSQVNLGEFKFEYFILRSQNIDLWINSFREMTVTFTSSGITVAQRTEIDWSRIGTFKHLLSEAEYQEFLKILFATGITKGNDLENHAHCSDCTPTRLEIRFDGETKKYKYTWAKPILYPLNQWLDRLMKHKSLVPIKK